MSRIQFIGVGAIAFIVLSGPALAEGDAAKGKESFANAEFAIRSAPPPKTPSGPS